MIFYKVTTDGAKGNPPHKQTEIFFFLVNMHSQLVNIFFKLQHRPTQEIAIEIIIILQFTDGLKQNKITYHQRKKD